VSRINAIYEKAKSSPNNFSFSELCWLAEHVDFEFKRPKGSHKFYKHKTIKGSIMNFQNDNGKAKPYQIKQLLNFIDEHDLI